MGLFPAKRCQLQMILLPICVQDVPPLVIVVLPIRVDEDPSEQIVLFPTIVQVCAVAANGETHTIAAKAARNVKEEQRIENS